MKVWGKSFAEYVAFQKPIIILIIVVGLLRLALSLGGIPTGTVKWVSLTLVSVIGFFYCAILVPLRGFGSYKHLLPLYFIQSMAGNLIIAGSIVLSALTGRENIYSAPEYSGPLASNPWLHAGGHLLDGLIVGPLIGWLFGSLIMWIVQKVSGTGTRVSAASAKPL